MKRSPGEGGFALLAAMWLLVALSLVGLELSQQARNRRLSALNLVERTQAVAAAQAGIEQAHGHLAYRLSSSPQLSRRATPLDPWHDLDTILPDTVALSDGLRFVVRVRDVGTALNLNRVTEDELRGLFIALRMDAGEADRLAQCILDWRDPDDLHRARGAERDAYLAANAPALPRNGPFQTLTELRFVRGMTADVYHRAVPFLTLSGSGQVNLNTADRPVLLALPGMTEEAVAVLLRLRRQRSGVGSLADLERQLSPGARRVLVAALPQVLTLATTETREVEVTSEGWLPGSPVWARVTSLLARGGGTVFDIWNRIE